MEAPANALGMRYIVSPDTGSETCSSLVGPLDDLLFVLPGLSRYNRAERLFLDDSGVVGWVVYDSGLDVKSLARLHVRLAYGELVALGLGIFEKAFYSLILQPRKG